MYSHLEKEVEFYKTIIDSCKTVVDVGCRNDNVFYELNNNLEVHLFDPNDDRVLDKIKGLSNVHFNNYALGNYEGQTEFHYRYGSILHRTEEPKFNDIHDVKIVNIDTLRNYCAVNDIVQIDILKIDTEGYDFEVIRGCGTKLLNNIRFIQFEDWTDYYNGIKLKDIFEFFRGRNIYKINSRPLNYVATYELIPSLEKLQ